MKPKIGDFWLNRVNELVRVARATKEESGYASDLNSFPFICHVIGTDRYYVITKEGNYFSEAYNENAPEDLKIKISKEENPEYWL